MKNLLLFMLPLLILVASCSDDEDDNPTLQEVTLDCNSITADRILDRAVYLVDCPITITNDAVLTIAAGSVFKFGSNGYLRTTDGGAINALGTADDKITFTGRQAVTNSWKGIKIFSNSPNTVFIYCNFEYGGVDDNDHEDYGQLVIGKYGNYTSYVIEDAGRARVSNCSFEGGAGPGLLLAKSGVLTDFTGNTFADNKYAVSVFFSEIEQITVGNTYGGSADSYVQVLLNRPTDDFTINALDVPYYFFDPCSFCGTGNYFIEDGVACTVAPGATLAFGPDRVLVISESGSLNAVGTATQKITFTGKQKTVGYWGQLYFINTNSSLNRLEHCIVEYCGGRQYSSGFPPGSICAEAVNRQTTLTINNSTIRNSASNGISIWISSQTSTFNGISATNCSNSTAIKTAFEASNTFTDLVGENFKCK